ncbi:MAG: primosomal protein N' [Candidatus Peribacteraceae bacterium]|jgi:primosomal protein N' (replication factor Y)|nr:primosomal protein N' [Candidatus Peribacteraceae bacterium]HCI03763.1 primosomal protein N' [Candidatus Peribacteria bacterium]|tara:strand:+ start:467 stop:2569 length:2103 start_codon:yes stop_codon:yes gene_type:complete
MLCRVLTRSRSPGIGNGLTYDCGDFKLREGSHVSIPLRKEIVEGVVFEVMKQRKEQDFDIKNVEEILAKSPLLNSAQLKTLEWMSNYYCCSLRQALRVWLPTPSWTKLKPIKELYFKLIDPTIPKRGANQQMIVEYLRDKDWAPLSQIKDEINVSGSSLKKLAQKDRLKMEEREEIYDSKIPEINEPKLTKTQSEAYKLINKSTKPSLLFGITSSGKTEIYAQMISDAVHSGKQAILLVPEILLTEHCIHRFDELLGPKHIAVVHSRLTIAQRRRTWTKIHNGGVSLVIGSRSALFAPVPDLGLIIIDEEHEWTYKNEQSPRYHARETAVKLCEFAGAKLVLGTATPSLESWSRAKSGEYQLVKLSERYMEQPLPKVRIIDLADSNFGSLYPFTPPLLDAISDRIKKHEQSVLFINRRGVSSALMCLDCKRRIVSPESNLPFTVHKDYQGNPYLLDHTTGTRGEVPATCPSCSSVRLHAIGAGTQRIEEILNSEFPNARLLRADSDTLTHPEHMRLLLKKMRENQADILLGTQSVVKGLDLPNVTLAGVLVADVGLSLPHFRAGERIFQLLTQLTGRSGRAKDGEVIIQTFRPHSPEVKFAAEHNTEEFLDKELKLRIHAGYPPATKMIRLIVREDSKAKAKELRDKIRSESDLIAHASPQLFGGGKTWQVLIRGDKPAEVLKKLDLKGVVVDVDPIETV